MYILDCFFTKFEFFYIMRYLLCIHFFYSYSQRRVWYVTSRFNVPSYLLICAVFLRSNVGKGSLLLSPAHLWGTATFVGQAAHLIITSINIAGRKNHADRVTESLIRLYWLHHTSRCLITVRVLNMYYF